MRIKQKKPGWNVKAVRPLTPVYNKKEKGAIKNEKRT